MGSLLLIIITFGGLSYAAEQGRHINMSAIHDLLPPRGRKVLTHVIELVTALVMLVMAYLSLRYVVQIADSGDVSSVLRVPLFIPLAVIPLAFLLTAVRYIFALFGYAPPAASDTSATGTPEAGES